jgi:aspartyl protease
MRRTAVFSLIAFILSFLAQASQAGTEIPFSNRAGMVWLKVAVAGRTEPLNFLLDSGAGATVLDLSAARRAGMKLGKRESVQGVQGRCAAYRVEGIAATVASVPIASSMLALDLSAVSQSCGSRIDGLLGADFFRERIVQIDYAAGNLRLLSRSELGTQPGQMLPLARRNDAMCVRVGVNGNAPEWMRVDTGCNSTLEWVASSASAKKSARTSVAAATGSPRAIHADVALGNERLSAVKIGMHDAPMFTGESGLLGNGVLSKFLVTIDAPKGRLILAQK